MADLPMNREQMVETLNKELERSGEVFVNVGRAIPSVGLLLTLLNETVNVQTAALDKAAATLRAMGNMDAALDAIVAANVGRVG